MTVHWQVAMLGKILPGRSMLAVILSLPPEHEVLVYHSQKRRIVPISIERHGKDQNVFFPTIENFKKN